MEGEDGTARAYSGVDEDVAMNILRSSCFRPRGRVFEEVVRTSLILRFEVCC